MRRLRIKVGGVVQGVGFRPFVHRLAVEMGLSGFVRNGPDGVIIEVAGEGAEGFPERLRREAPPLARIQGVEVESLDGGPCTGPFRILTSLDGEGAAHVSPDASLCPDCRRELLDPADRRYLYPFINCTNCGPRYTITRRLPYDRPNTTMEPFPMCPACEREYRDPSNRRFHAQPNACPACGPTLRYLDDGGGRAAGREALRRAVEALRAGRIVAVKGLGGFHLAVDARQADAVRELRDRKRRSNKSFALMAADLDAVRRYAEPDEAETALLLSRERPIVLLSRGPGADLLPPELAPRSAELGFMLPYTPLHELLFRMPLTDDGPLERHFEVLVMTSGNLSEEPIVADDGEARQRLLELADAWLLHDREIFSRIDDSVVRVFAGGTFFIRRARGYVPAALPLPGKGPSLLACGADLKNSFALTRDDGVVVSPHIGDLENLETQGFFEEVLARLSDLYGIRPEGIVHDLHPGYHSTRWAESRRDLPRVALQHHYAHTASVMAAHGLRENVLGVSLDGTGYGPDGTVWGGEFLLAGIRGFERLGRFSTVPLPGGRAGVRFPWMMAIAVLVSVFGDEAGMIFEALGLADRHGEGAVLNAARMAGNPETSWPTSSAGRLFDAVSALLGIAEINTFEGEAAMALEAEAAPGEDGTYGFDLGEGDLLEIDFSQTIRDVMADVNTKTDRRRIAARFHNTVAAAVVETAARLCRARAVSDVALSGGVFQNRRLLGAVRRGLVEKGLRVHVNTFVPPNDAGIALGQAYIVRERMREETGSHFLRIRQGEDVPGDHPQDP